MKFSPEVGPGQRHNLLDFGDDPSYDSDPARIRITIQIEDPDYAQDYNQISRIVMQFLPEVCLGLRTNP